MNTFAAHRVTYIPSELLPGILYVSTEYQVAGHLCACGCAAKVITPLGPAEWTYSERSGLPTLRPSIGSWQLPCQSHYFITQGRIQWADRWTDTEIAAARRAEDQQRQAYYRSINSRRSLWLQLWNWVRKLFAR